MKPKLDEFIVQVNQHTIRVWKTPRNRYGRWATEIIGLGGRTLPGHDGWTIEEAIEKTLELLRKAEGR